MDDKRLEEVFSSLPYRCVVLIEDIDCAGAQVSRDFKSSSNAEVLDDDEEDSIEATAAANLIERAMDKYFQRQSQHNDMMLKFLTDFAERNTSQQQSRAPRPVIPSPPKKVTLSGLLNVIDGATAAEGRLLIMTTNHPENLDPALLRKGRIDRHFEIGYATKITAELTFKRIFGQDTSKRHTSEAINRFAKAFRDQFPTHSKIPTATLTQYCMQYQRRPCEAVRDFAQYLELGDAMWSYTIDGSGTLPGSGINVPEPFDHELLKVRQEDFVRPSAVPKCLRDIEARPVRSLWRPSTWIGPSKAKISFAESEPPACLPIKKAGEVGHEDIISEEDAQLDELFGKHLMPSNSRQARIKAHLDSLGLTSKLTSSKNSSFSSKADEPFDFDDEDFGDFPELTLLDNVPSTSPIPCSSLPSVLDEPQESDQYIFISEDPSMWTDDPKNTSNETSSDDGSSTPISSISSYGSDFSAVTTVYDMDIGTEDDAVFFDALEEIG